VISSDASPRRKIDPERPIDHEHVEPEKEIRTPARRPSAETRQPVAKLTTVRNPISTRKPVRLSERMRASAAAEKKASAGPACGSKSVCLRSSGISIPGSWPKSSAPKSHQGSPYRAQKIGQGQQRKNPAKAAPKARLQRNHQKPKPWTAAGGARGLQPVSQRQFRSRRAKLEHLNPLYAAGGRGAVGAGEPTPASTGRRARLFAVADTPGKRWLAASARDSVRRFTSRNHRASIATRRKNVIALSEKTDRPSSASVVARATPRRESKHLPGRRPQDRQLSCLNMALWRAYDGGRQPMVFPRRQTVPEWAARQQTCLEVELGAGENHFRPNSMLHAHHWLILHGPLQPASRASRAARSCLINDLLPLAGEGRRRFCAKPSRSYHSTYIDCRGSPRRLKYSLFGRGFYSEVPEARVS